MKWKELDSQEKEVGEARRLQFDQTYGLADTICTKLIQLVASNGNTVLCETRDAFIRSINTPQFNNDKIIMYETSVLSKD